MKATSPYQLLSKWRNRDNQVFIATLVLFSFLLYTVYTNQILELGYTIGALLIGFSGLILIERNHKIQPVNVTNLAHEQNPQLEFSAQLLQEDIILTSLARLQKKRIEKTFQAVDYKIPWNSSKIGGQLLFIVALVIGSIAVQNLFSNQFSTNGINPGSKISAITANSSSLSRDTTFVKEIHATIIPPSYTNLSTRRSSTLDIDAVEGSRIRWTLEMTGKIDKLFFMNKDQDTTDLGSAFTLTKEFRQSDIYRYGFKSPSHDYVSDYHAIKIIPDQKPKIEITGIDEFVRLPWKEDHKISLEIEISDDYRLTEGHLIATIAKGSGEAVKFREKRFDLPRFSPGVKNYRGSYSFSTKALNMEPGDELYFFIAANDNYPYGSHWSKSTTYFISIQDTASYALVDDSGMQVDLMPDFFRSQRQIIIDSEKLVKNRALISVDSFNRASNMLGYDQKMLRLKYGQFLGEENESGIQIENEIGEEDHDHNEGENHDHEETSDALKGARDLLEQYMHDHDHEEEEGQLMSTKGTDPKKDPSRPTWVEELSHNHDNTEIATFHNVSVKSKLKAALSEMWDAELHLRLYDPKTSLTYQYSSLELLQEIKNHARIYVHRVGFDPPAIKEADTRLVGDLDEIYSTSQRLTIENDDIYRGVKEAIAHLGDAETTNYKQTLEDVINELAGLSIAYPEIFPILNLAQSIDITNQNDRQKLRIALLKVLPEQATVVKGVNNAAHDISLTVAKKIQ